MKFIAMTVILLTALMTGCAYEYAIPGEGEQPVTNPVVILNPSGITYDSATLHGIVYTYPYLDILWSPSQDIFLHSDPELEFLCGKGESLELVSWHNLPIKSHQLGPISAHIDGQLESNTQYYCRVLLIISDIRRKADNSLFDNTPKFWWSNIVSFTTPAR